MNPLPFRLYCHCIWHKLGHLWQVNETDLTLHQFELWVDNLWHNVTSIWTNWPTFGKQHCQCLCKESSINLYSNFYWGSQGSHRQKLSIGSGFRLGAEFVSSYYSKQWWSSSVTGLQWVKCHLGLVILTPGPAFYLWLSKFLANGKRCYIWSIVALAETAQPRQKAGFDDVARYLPMEEWLSNLKHTTYMIILIKLRFLVGLYS